MTGILQRFRDRCYAPCCWVGIVVREVICVTRSSRACASAFVRAGLDKRSVEFGKLLFVNEVAAARINDMILCLVFDNGTLGSRSLASQLVQPILQPRRGLPYGLVPGLQLIDNKRVRHCIGDLRGTVWIDRLKRDLDSVRHAHAADRQLVPRTRRTARCVSSSSDSALLFFDLKSVDTRLSCKAESALH